MVGRAENAADEFYRVNRYVFYVFFKFFFKFFNLNL